MDHFHDERKYMYEYMNNLGLDNISNCKKISELNCEVTDLKLTISRLESKVYSLEYNTTKVQILELFLILFLVYILW